MIPNDAHSNEQIDPASNILNHCKVKGDYTQDEKKLMAFSINDYQESLQIHRDLVIELAKSQTEKQELANFCIKLIKENDQSFSKFKILIDEISKNLVQEFIFNQIEENYKQKEEENLHEFEENMKEMKEKIDIKDYEIQNLEKKFAEAKLILKKYVVGHDSEICQLEKTNKMSKISQVIEENLFLNSKVNNMRIKLQKYEEYMSENNILILANEKLHTISQALNEKLLSQEKEIKELDKNIELLEAGQKLNSPNQKNPTFESKRESLLFEVKDNQDLKGTEDNDKNQVDILNLSAIKSPDKEEEIVEEDDIFDKIEKIDIKIDQKN